MKTHYQRQIVQLFDDEKYHRSNMVETPFSILKQSSVNPLMPGNTPLLIKEINIKVILYDISFSLGIFYSVNHLCLKNDSFESRSKDFFFRPEHSSFVI